MTDRGRGDAGGRDGTRRSHQGRDGPHGNDHEPDHARVVADADVLAADLLVGEAARASLDILRSHTWLELVATDRLLDDGEAIVGRLADEGLAADWRERLDRWAVVVEQPAGDHPALAAAYRGDAAHVVSMDDRLQSARAGASLRAQMAVSVRSPEAFASVFDPEATYELLFEDAYPGPDRGPRA